MSDYDIIIIGSGAGGGTLAHSLAATGKRILIVERGDYLPREKQNWNVKAVFIENRYRTKELWKDGDGRLINPGAQYYVGGNTKVYGAALLRLREKDFEEVHHSGGVSPKWPLSYHDFQPYYLAAEKLYHVHGQRGVDPTEPPEASPFPYKPVSQDPPIQSIYDKLKGKGLNPFPLPLGLILNEDNKEECPCIRCDTCDGFPCLVDGKADAEVVCVKPALKYPNVSLLTNAKAIRLETDSTGRKVTRLEVEREGKREFYSADTIVVSCGAINSAALLLRSKNDKHPNGLANSSGLVGRNYMCHINTAMIAISQKKNLVSFQKTFGMNDFYFNSPDWNYPLGHIQLLGNVKKDMLRGNAPLFTPDGILKTMADHAVGWWISSEDLPSPDNRVTLDKDGGIVLHYKSSSEEGHNRLVEKLKGILRTIDDSFLPGIYLTKRIPIEGVAHQVGTCRFGNDPKDSVLDIHCKAHDLDNLYVVDGSFFPSSAGLNPALTIIANALRVSEEIKKG